ncbi:MAG TPA: DUF1385 domain-containing protein [Polyangiaceae bacterium]|nr:DUF1385 domain-containing protein [Polyangiaceae bacterium]
MSKRPYIGGQAVLEGVMMRAPRSFAVVVRRRDGSLLVRERGMTEGPHGMLRWPLLRGVASLVESLKLGSEALRFSAEQMEKDLASSAGAGVGALLKAVGLSLFAMATSDDGQPVQSPGASGGGGARRLGSWLMLAVAITFFVALPQGAAASVNRFLHLGLEVQSPQFQAITGAFKLTIVVGYLLAIRRIPDIRRVFQYHGAEHKAISTYEAGEALTVANARAKTTLHPRCGTTFLVMVALVSILVFTAIGAALPRIHTGSVLADNLVFFVEKLPFLPVIVAVTFEIQRLFARYFTTGPLRAFLWPGFLVQKITTAEPEDGQLEVALASLRATLFRQDRGDRADVNDDVRFGSYDALLAAQRLR